MGYSRLFKPTAEAIEKIKPWNYGKSNSIRDNNIIDNAKLEILIYCMENHKPEDIAKTIKDLRYKMSFLELSYYDDYKRSIYEEWINDGEITFYGWQFSRSEPDLDKEELYNLYMQSLCVLSSIVKTPDYFDDSEKFYTKINDIKNDIEGFIEGLSDIFAFQIMDMFKEFRIPDYDFENHEDEIPESVSVSENDGKDNNEEEPKID